MTFVYVGVRRTEAEALADRERDAARDRNRATIAEQAHIALAANLADLAADATIITQAQALVDNPATTLTATQAATVVKQLAQGVAILASNDANSKRELNALIRLVLGEVDET